MKNLFQTAVIPRIKAPLTSAYDYSAEEIEELYYTKVVVPSQAVAPQEEIEASNTICCGR
jgi:hypothetical protein